MRLLKRLPLRLEFPGRIALARAAPARAAAPGRRPCSARAACRWREKLAADPLHAALQARRLPPARRTSPSPHCWTASPDADALAPLPVGAAVHRRAQHPADARLGTGFLNVLRDSLGGDARRQRPAAAAQRLLGRCFPSPPQHYVRNHGGDVLRGARDPSDRVERLRLQPRGRRTAGRSYTHVVVAVAPYHLVAWRQSCRACSRCWRTSSVFHWEPIVTAYLGYPPPVRLPGAMLGVPAARAVAVRPRPTADDRPARGRHQRPRPRISTCRTRRSIERIHAEIAGIICPTLPAPPGPQVIIEKRATFACRPGCSGRPATRRWPISVSGRRLRRLATIRRRWKPPCAAASPAPDGCVAGFSLTRPKPQIPSASEARPTPVRRSSA